MTTSNSKPPEATPAAAAAPTYRRLLPGDPAPSMIQACDDRPRFSFDSMAGRYQLFCFFLTLNDPLSQAALSAASARRTLFDDINHSFIGVSITPSDAQLPGIKVPKVGIRTAWDFDFAMSKACGAVPLDAVASEATPAWRRWVLVDPQMRVLKVFEFTEPPETVLDYVAALPPPNLYGGVKRPAPILMIPNVLEPEVCAELIALYHAQGGQESGFIRAGQAMLDPTFKRRKDLALTDTDLLNRLNARVARRVLPDIEKLFFMRARYIERHIVGCYDAGDGGHFAPHVDNSPGLAAHRRFAVSINLNDGFEGGEVVFPEYNTDGYKAPPGWAVVFPAAILHQVRAVTKGTRYAFLPFVYDEGGKAIREEEIAKAQAAGTYEAGIKVG